MSNFTFGALLAACILIAAGVYAVKIAPEVRRVEKGALDLRDRAAHGETIAPRAVGEKTFSSQERRQDEVRADLRVIETFFADLDRNGMEQWFPALGLEWEKEPSPADFKRFYNLTSDQLMREVLAETDPKKLEPVARQLREYPWQKGGELPAKEELRSLQRDFWIQDRILRSFARAGAILTKPLGGGEVQKGMHPQAGGAAFDMIRFEAHVRCKSDDVLKVVHALDRPIEVIHEDGRREVIALPVVVDTVTIRTLPLEAAMLARSGGEPPVEATFFLTVLDYHVDR